MFDVNFIPAGTGVNIPARSEDEAAWARINVEGPCPCDDCAYRTAMQSEHYYSDFGNVL